MLSEYYSVFKYSSIDKVIEAAVVGGYDGSKGEKDRKFLSDLKLLFTEYNDMPFTDLKEIVSDFNNGLLECEVLIIDIREPVEIERAKVAFNAITALVKNANVPLIESNTSDANVFNYEYDYIITNNGTFEDLQKETKKFVKYLKQTNN